MKKGNSDYYPEIIIRSNNYYQCRYNIKETYTIDDYDEERKTFNYDYIELKNVNNHNITEALIEDGCDEYIVDIVNNIMIEKVKQGI